MADGGIGYIKSIPGIFKILEVLFGFIGLLIVAIDSYMYDTVNAYIVGASVTIIVSFLILMLLVTQILENDNGLAIRFQAYFHLLWFLYMLVTSAVMLSESYGDMNSKYQAGGAFGILISIVYLLDGLYCVYYVPPPPLSSFLSR